MDGKPITTFHWAESAEKAVDTVSWADHKKIRKIFLCLDNDTAGNAACEKLAEKIPDDKMVMRLRPVKKGLE